MDFCTGSLHSRLLGQKSGSPTAKNCYSGFHRLPEGGNVCLCDILHLDFFFDCSSIHPICAMTVAGTGHSTADLTRNIVRFIFSRSNFTKPRTAVYRSPDRILPDFSKTKDSDFELFFDVSDNNCPVLFLYDYLGECFVFGWNRVSRLI